jgi:hypothetical protein
MGYRGEDLDLRTPRAGVPPADFGHASGSEGFFGEARGGRELYGASPSRTIWVDATLLDCSNHAFDVAEAHRAREVGLAHLIYALTGIPAARDALEARPIHIEVLRREAAAEIMNEAPMDPAIGKVPPRRSNDLEDLLRHAAARAYRRNAPASVDDVLDVLADPASGLARRLPPSLRRIAAGSGTDEPLRDRPREYARGEPRPPPLRTELAPRPGPGRNTRLDALAEIVRVLSNNLANEHHILSGVLHDLQREIMAHRDDTGPYEGRHPMFSDPGERNEPGLLASRPSLGADLSLLHDRIGSLERALQAELAEARVALEALAARSEHALDLAPVSRRLDAIEEALLAHALPERLRALEDALATETERAKHAHDTLAAEIRGLATAVAQLTSAAPSWSSEAGGRLATLEQATSDSAARMADVQAALAEERTTLHDALVQLNANQHTLAGSLDAWREESTHTVAAFGGRLETLERTTVTSIEMLETLSNAVSSMHKMLAERLFRRKRFWHWLFGTDDWVGASWPAKSARGAEPGPPVTTPPPPKR